MKYTISAGRNLIFQPGLAVAAALNLTGIMINGQVRRPGEGGVGASGNRTEMTLDAQIVISALSTVCINHTVYLRVSEYRLVMMRVFKHLVVHVPLW